MKEACTTRSRLFGLTMLSGFAGLAGVVALLVLSLMNEFQDSSQHARAQVENTSRLLEEHALATVQKIDLLLREVQRNVRPDDMRLDRAASSSRRQELQALLKAQAASVPEVAVIYVTNGRGDHIYGSLDPVPRINVADRYHFTHNRDNTAAGMVITPPVVSRTTGKWAIVLSRRLNFEDGSFAGIVDIVMNMEYFQQFYRSLDLGTHGLVALYTRELHLAARYPPSEKDMGKVSNINARASIEKGIRQATYHTKSPLDGIERLHAFRQVGELPLFVFAGIAGDDYLADWHAHIWQYGLVATIFSLVVIGFGLRQQRAETTIHGLNAALEQRVAQRTAQLEAANKELEEFSYSMSHDMRSPLRALDGFSKILLVEHGAGLDDEGKRLLNIVRDNAQRMARLIDDILRFLGMGRRKMECSSVDVAALAAETFAALQAAAPERRLRLGIGALPPAWGDRDMIRLVVLNLLSNAIKFSPADAEAVIEVGGTAGEEEDIYFVTDHGVGFDMRYADKLFRVFERVHPTGQYEGTGIGLAIVKRIVERHGGRVWAEGKVGAGASFHFALPRPPLKRASGQRP